MTTSKLRSILFLVTIPVFACDEPASEVSSTGSRGSPTIHRQLFSQDSAGIGNAADDNDAFGTALASGDFDCDGYADLAIGAPGERSGDVTNAGSVHILFGSARGLSSSRSQLIVPTELVDDSYFGSFLAAGNIDADVLDGNECDDLAVGIPGARGVDQSASGAVAVRSGGDNGLGDVALWRRESRDGAVEKRAGDEFGRGVWLIDENVDGYADLLAYSAGDDTTVLIRGTLDGLALSSGAGPASGPVRATCYFLCAALWKIVVPPGPVCTCDWCETIQAPNPDPCPNCG